MSRPRCVMIAMSDNEISQHYKNYVLPTWKVRGWNVDLFEAVTPKTMGQYSYLNFGKKRGTIPFTDTEIAVWYSHVECWVLARKEPVLIIEHDMLLNKDIPDNIFESDMACLANHKGGKLAGGAYYLTPETAIKMVNDIKHTKEIRWNSDATIHSWCDKVGIWSHDICTQYQDDNIGVTVVHNKK